MTSNKLQILAANFESKYKSYISKQNFTDIKLKNDFLELLENYSCLEREIIWDTLKTRIANDCEANKLANPYYIGFGNPNSSILFIGKEKAFNFSKSPDLFVKESINNTLHWQSIEECYDLLNHHNVNKKYGFNPFFPKLYHTRKLSSRHTWGLYSHIVAGINKLSNDCFNESVDYDQSFFSKCFMTEINHIPSKYSNGLRMTEERKDLLTSQFYKEFKTIIIGAKGYLTINEIKSLLNISADPNEIIVGKSKSRQIKIWKFVEAHKIIIYCNQLSGAAGWTNEAIENLIKQASMSE